MLIINGQLRSPQTDWPTNDTIKSGYSIWSPSMHCWTVVYTTHNGDAGIMADDVKLLPPQRVCFACDENAIITQPITLCALCAIEARDRTIIIERRGDVLTGHFLSIHHIEPGRWGNGVHPVDHLTFEALMEIDHYEQTADLTQH